MGVGAGMRAEAVLPGQRMPSHVAGDESEIRGLEGLDAGDPVVVGAVIAGAVASTVAEAVEQGPQSLGRALYTQMSPGQSLQLVPCQCRLVE